MKKKLGYMDRSDHHIISQIIDKNARVIDLGCGDGKLLSLLAHTKQIDGCGIEISAEGVRTSISKGLSVIQGNLEEIISNYPANHFDYSILSQTLQELRNPDFVLDQMTRISHHALIAFFNLAHLKFRLKILFKGRFPQSKDMPYSWQNTNILFLSVKEFDFYCQSHGLQITRRFFIARDKLIHVWPNLRADLCIFEISRL